MLKETLIDLNVLVSDFVRYNLRERRSRQMSDLLEGDFKFQGGRRVCSPLHPNPLSELLANSPAATSQVANVSMYLGTNHLPMCSILSS